MGFFILGFLCGFGSAVAWALTNKPKKNATYTTEDDDKDAEKDPFRTW